MKYVLLLLLPYLSQSQDSTKVQPTAMPVLSQINDQPSPKVFAVNYLEKRVWRVLFLSPGVTYEFRVGPKTSFVSDLRLTGGWVATGTSGTAGSGFYSSYYVSSLASIGIRHFYNFERRLIQGKSIRYNSGNYLMLKTGYELPPFVEHHESQSPLTVRQGPSISVLWGFQRTYRRNFYLNLALGLGASTYYTGLASDFVIGYTFPNSSH